MFGFFSGGQAPAQNPNVQHHQMQMQHNQIINAKNFAPSEQPFKIIESNMAQAKQLEGTIESL